MKTIHYFWVIALSVTMLSACEKAVITPGNTLATGSTHADGLCVQFAYELHKFENNTYNCIPPMVDCSRIYPCSAISTLDIAVTNNTLTTYFGTQANWECLFPNLLSDTTLLGQLQIGTKVVIKRTYSSGTTPAYYFVVASGTTVSHPNTSDVSYTIRVQ